MYIFIVSDDKVDGDHGDKSPGEKDLQFWNEFDDPVDNG